MVSNEIKYLARFVSNSWAKVLHTLVERITVRKSGITIKWHDKGLNKLLLDTLEPQKELEAA